MQFRFILSALLLAPMAQGQELRASTPPTVSLAEQLKILKQQLAEQQRVVDALARKVAAHEAGTQPNDVTGGRRPSGQTGADISATGGEFQSAAALHQEQLAQQRGTGAGQGAAQPIAPSPGATPQASSTPQPAAAGQASRAAGVQNGPAVGRPPRRDTRPPEVAPLFEQPGVLTPRGKLVLEPALQ